MPYPPRVDVDIRPDTPDTDLAQRLLRDLRVHPVSAPWTARALTRMAGGSIVAVNGAGELQHRDPSGHCLGWPGGVPRRMGRPVALTAVGDDEVAVLCRRRWSRETMLLTWEVGCPSPFGALPLPWPATVVVGLGCQRVAIAAPSGPHADRVDIVDTAAGRVVKSRLRIGRYSHHPGLGPWRPGDAAASPPGPPRLTSLTRAGESLLGITDEGCLSVWAPEPPFSLRLTVASPGGRVHRCLAPLGDGNTLFVIRRPEGDRLQVMDWAHMKFIGLPEPAARFQANQSLYLALLEASSASRRGHISRVLGGDDSGAAARADVLLELHDTSIGMQDLTLMSPCPGGRFLTSRRADGQGDALVQVMQLGL